MNYEEKLHLFDKLIVGLNKRPILEKNKLVLYISEEELKLINIFLDLDYSLITIDN